MTARPIRTAWKSSRPRSRPGISSGRFANTASLSSDRTGLNRPNAPPRKKGKPPWSVSSGVNSRPDFRAMSLAVWIVRSRVLIVLAALVGAGGTSSAEDCRTQQDPPPGVRVPERFGCRTSKAASPEKPARPNGVRASGDAKPARASNIRPLVEEGELRSNQKSGFIDLGNGTEVRVNGRVRVETRIAR